MNKNWIYKVKRLVTSHKAGDWCQLPYPGHKRGCPKYDNDDGCPPRVTGVRYCFDVSRPLYLVHSEYDLKGRAGDLQAIHPGWSERQCRCVLYWQSQSRKQLRDRVWMARFATGACVHTLCPEGMGVNVYVTARLAGLRLERIRGLSTCRHVALLGWLPRWEI